MLAVVCLAFISLLIVCSASWVIKSLTDQYFKWPTWTTTDAAELDTYINDVYEDTLDEYFTTGGIYNGQSQAPKLKDVDAANALFGHLRRDGEGDDAFLERMNDEAFTAYWEAGLYFNITDNDGKIPLESQGGGHLHGKCAGTHYYRIVDDNTGSVISYKHAVRISQDTLYIPETGGVNITGSGDTPRFVHEKISYSVKWLGAKSGKAFNTPRFDDTIAELMAQTGVSFGSSPHLRAEVEIQIADCYDNKNIPAIDNNNFDFSTAENITFNYTAIATAYSQVKAETPTYYGTIAQALDATDDLAFDETQGKVVTKDETPAGTNVVPMYSVSGTVVFTDATGAEKTVTYSYVNRVLDNSKRGYEHKIDQNCTIGPDVTLIIPHDLDMGYYSLALRQMEC